MKKLIASMLIVLSLVAMLGTIAMAYDTCWVCGEDGMTSKGASATCTKSGYEIIYCVKCDAEFFYPGEPALGHNYVNDVCTRCGDSK